LSAPASIGSRSSGSRVVPWLLAAILLWGANNVSLKQVLSRWPPLFTGSTRFLAAGFLLLAIARNRRLFGDTVPMPQGRGGRLWMGGLLLALYVAACNWTLHFLPASHFALHMAVSPAWALLLEGRVEAAGSVRLRRWSAVFLTFCGVGVLLLPSLGTDGSGVGHLFGISTGLLWTFYSRECRRLGEGWSGAAVSAHTMWRGGLLLVLPAIVEILRAQALPVMDPRTLGFHVFCITLGGIVPFSLWTRSLTRWPVSKVALFGNLIPLTTASWDFLVFGTPLSATFWAATVLILGGVALSQWEILKQGVRWWIPEE